MAGLLAPGPTIAKAEELRKRRGSRGLLEAVGEPMSYAPNPVVAAVGQGLLGARYLTGEKELGSGLASLSDMTAMAVGSRLPPAIRNVVVRGYHGTNKDFEKFNTDANEGRLGAYFSKDTDYANVFSKYYSPFPEVRSGARVIPVDLHLKNPASMKEIGEAIDAGHHSMKDIRKYLEARGFDGVIKDDEMVAFHPDQIKSIFSK